MLERGDAAVRSCVNMSQCFHEVLPPPWPSDNSVQPGNVHTANIQSEQSLRRRGAVLTGAKGRPSEVLYLSTWYGLQEHGRGNSEEKLKSTCLQEDPKSHMDVTLMQSLCCGEHVDYTPNPDSNICYIKERLSIDRL